jgi:enterochelin esterase-like enzyme
MPNPLAQLGERVRELAHQVQTILRWRHYSGRTTDSMNKLKTFEQQLVELHDIENKTEREKKAAALYAAIKKECGTPMALEGRAHFFFYGDASHVMLAGDWTYWQMATPFERVAETKLFQAVLEFPPTARLQYKLVVDGNWILDPGNPHTSAEGFGVNSEFWMDEYEDRSFLTLPKNQEVKRGTITRHSLKSEIVHEDREFFLFTPSNAAADPLVEHQLLLIHDGAEAISIGRFHHILDNLMAAGKLPSTCAIFIPPHNRHTEYALNKNYEKFCVEEVIPKAVEIWKERGVKISEEPQDRCVTGASLGGLLATQTVLDFPKQLGAVIAQSPAYWVTRGAIFRPASLKNAPDILFVLQTGTVCDARELTRIMYARLRNVSAEVTCMEYVQGHTWGNWRTNLAEGLLAWQRLKNVVLEHG